MSGLSRSSPVVELSSAHVRRMLAIFFPNSPQDIDHRKYDNLIFGNSQSCFIALKRFFT